MLMMGSTVSEDKFYVKKSGIHGKGLFARCYIKKEEIIGSIKFIPTDKDGPYVLWIESQGIVVESDLKYINHNSLPNACYCDDLDVVALRDINIDEEITHDYGEEWV